MLSHLGALVRLSLFAMLMLGAPLPAQGTRADYERAAALGERWQGKLREFRPSVHWLEDGSLVYRVRAADGKGHEFVRVAADGARKRTRDAAEVGLELPIPLQPRRSMGRSSGTGPRTTVRFENKLDRKVRLFWVDRRGQTKAYGEIEPGGTSTQSTFAGHAWVVDFKRNDLAGAFVASELPGVAVIDKASRALTRQTAREPRKPDRVFLREHDVWLRAGKEPRRLTDNGTANDAYRKPLHVSPDGKRALVFQIERGEEHLVHVVESKPKDQVQPKLHSWSYRKPGDRIDRPRPRLFDLAKGKQIAVDEAPFACAWSIGRVHWSPDGSEVFLLHNRRGHQALTIFAIDAKTGAVRSVLEERSETFIDYSQKTWLHWLEGGREFLWMSERSGYNHLYRVNAKTGAIKPVTKGKWVVRSVDHVDEEAGEVWFSALGLGQFDEPYHAHLARARLKGGGLYVLTDNPGMHQWQFSPDRSRFVARWSRVDHPEVTELRDARTGALIAELGRDDATDLLAAGYRQPIRFVAKGRDGTTDIHGILIPPSNFDPAKRYPVVEAIYAGPHGHHVPQTWGLGLRQRRLAELGFVVVQIDGMGTNWRSKAFHDVCWRNLKDAGFPDRIAWLRAAAAKFPWLDISRVGIYGGSAGGQNALAALLHHGDFYQVAVSDCGCHDNRMDKIWWNEAWMGWPVGDWYADSSNVTHAGKLTGKLMLTVGELDPNVDPASTMQVVGALIEADKDFDLVVVPGAGHGIGESTYLQRRRQDFFVRHLLGVEPRAR